MIRHITLWFIIWRYDSSYDASYDASYKDKFLLHMTRHSVIWRVTASYDASWHHMTRHRIWYVIWRVIQNFVRIPQVPGGRVLFSRCSSWAATKIWARKSMGLGTIVMEQRIFWNLPKLNISKRLDQLPQKFGLHGIPRKTLCLVLSLLGEMRASRDCSIGSAAFVDKQRAMSPIQKSQSLCFTEQK